MDYCTLDQVIGKTGENAITGYLPQVTDDEAKAKVSEIISRVSRRIDAYVTDATVEDYFAPAAQDASTKKIRGEGVSYLSLPEFVPGTVSAVTAPAGFTVPDFEEEGQTLVIRDSYGARTRSRAWLEDVPYTVTARWGLAAVPAPIIEAALQLVVRTYRAGDEAFSGVIGGIRQDGSIIERGWPAAVKEILDGYRRRFRSRRFLLA